MKSAFMPRYDRGASWNDSLHISEAMLSVTFTISFMTNGKIASGCLLETMALNAEFCAHLVISAQSI